MANPLYREIAENLREQIESGALAPGDKLPAEPDFCYQYAASRNTIRDAIKYLMSLGLVETRPGQGIFVRKKTDPFFTTLTRDPESGFGGSYLRGELAGSLAIADEITRSTIAIPPDQSSGDPWQQYIKARFGGALSNDTDRHREPWSSTESFFPIRGVEHWADDDSIASSFSRPHRSAAQLLMRYSEKREQLQAAALACLLVIIFAVATAIFSAVRSIFRFTTSSTIIVKIFMTHRNSREPAYSLTPRPPFYQSSAGVALGH